MLETQLDSSVLHLDPERCTGQGGCHGIPVSTRGSKHVCQEASPQPYSGAALGIPDVKGQSLSWS